MPSARYLLLALALVVMTLVDGDASARPHVQASVSYDCGGYMTLTVRIRSDVAREDWRIRILQTTAESPEFYRGTTNARGRLTVRSEWAFCVRYEVIARSPDRDIKLRLP